MKIKYFAIPKIAVDEFGFAIRNKTDYYKLLFKSIQLILASTPTTRPSNNVMVLHIDKTSRLIYKTTTRLFSINFPFTLIENGNDLEICLHGSKIDSRLCSRLICLLDDVSMNMEDLLEKIYEDVPSFWVKEIIEILSELNKTDSGYVRFDDDPENEDGKKHPKFHFDFFFDTATNVKVGLTEQLSLKQFTEILDLSKNCWYLKDKIK